MTPLLEMFYNYDSSLRILFQLANVKAGLKQSQSLYGPSMSIWWPTMLGPPPPKKKKKTSGHSSYLNLGYCFLTSEHICAYFYQFYWAENVELYV